MRRFSHEHGARRRHRLEPRGAELTRSPATMPWFVAPSVTAASPVITPARAWMGGPSACTASTSSRPARTARSASSSWAVGSAPDGHDGVADELLDRAAVAADHVRGKLEVARQRVAHVLGVALLGERREADEVGEEDGHQPTLGDGSGARRPGYRPRRAASRSRRRIACRAGCSLRNSGSRRPRTVPQSPQKRFSAGFSAPQFEQINLDRPDARVVCRQAYRKTRGCRTSRAPSTRDGGAANPQMADRWATFDCYGTLIDWEGGIRSTLVALWPDADADALKDRYHLIEQELQAGAGHAVSTRSWRRRWCGSRRTRA